MAGLTPTRTNNSNVRDHTWLASREGVENARSVTLHAASLNAAGSHKLENWLRGGTPLGEITAVGATKGQYGLYDPTATDGRQKHAGFLLDSVQLSDPVTGQANVPITGALHARGQVLVNRLPVTFDASDADVSPYFIYRTQ
ncbi:LamD-like capsid decoration protein [Gordonia phage Emianna]|uniref:LamD-like capsid decoration protein n=3 Tax=Foxborovirus TaxID=2948710 RepID=A0A385UCH1_9CAUD|nr:head decoration [Gordonia phage NatB6]YP_010098285.1 head decoration [Gordonia phage Foxboro]YP_010098916.1 head decoration [Gordonia phage Emianna]AYD84142.1 LamD-like capsid decoration protein [Gordonia phage Jifall16]AYD84300.1 LamD-like capsid decoration protein [Gordonia phage Kurt]QZD98871.1 LamD-like capsid decoration protein [Gordonia phage Tracker]AXH50308.1 LamD-like capsid decoration protein [Gordonia phage NatB6]AYB69201.1 LamD-like capsid decoration protein [Gordonia phage Fo